jgi:Zn-dependent peptidase ImmA (M78 family)
MLPEWVKTYTVRELENLSRKYLARYFGDDVLIPVDVDLLVEKAEGIVLDFWPKLRANYNTLGMVARDANSGEFLVFIDADLADNESPGAQAQYRVTVAEELAHIHLHRSLIEAVVTPKDFRELHNHSQWAEIERDARKFAGMLLMPTKQLMIQAREIYSQIVRQPQIQAELIRSVSAKDRWASPIKKWLCHQMARRFEVSERMMDHRLGEWPSDVYKHVDGALEVGSDTLL